MPGDAMFPGSTIFSVTMPSKGAAIVVKDSVVLAWSPAARALSTADAACNARADAPATRASALRSVAVASSSSCAVADRLACRPAMRSWDARARARPASAAWSSAAAAFDPCSAARAAERAARAPAARSSPSSTMSVWPSRTRSPGDTRTSRTGARMRAVIVAVVRACTTPPESIALATSVIATWAMVTAMGSAASAGAAAARRAEHPASAALIKSAAVTPATMT